MAEIKRISPSEAQQLVDGGYVYVDVRSVGEFEAEHPAGAYNVPLMHLAAGGMTPNAEFVAVMTARFPKDAKLVVGCKTGGRSLRAAQTLAGVGYSDVIDQRAGFDGGRDPFGGLTEPGWKAAKLPVEVGDGGDKGWAKLSAKK
jgi:rhodanese-related sulfurtransferase